jgi:hypothetical protein
MRISEKFLKSIDKWRAKQDDKLCRAEASAAWMVTQCRASCCPAFAQSSLMPSNWPARNSAGTSVAETPWPRSLFYLGARRLLIVNRASMSLTYAIPDIHGRIDLLELAIDLRLGRFVP